MMPIETRRLYSVEDAWYLAHEEETRRRDAAAERLADDLGYSVPGGDPLRVYTCPTCAAAVTRSNVQRHHDWHQTTG